MRTRFILLFFYSLAFCANARDVCAFKAWNHLDFSLQTGSFASGTCYISIGSRKLNDLIYRNYLITSDGQIMVFNSFGSGPSTSDTGARVFYLYPRTGELDLTLRGDQIVVQLVSGHRLIFDPSSVDLFSMEGGSVQVQSQISRRNAGGVEIELDHSYMLDMGFKLGNTPVWDLERQSFFINSKGEKCSFKNEELFYKKGGEVYPRYPADNKLESVITSKCPNFDLIHLL